jgi:hypothetical protein
VPPGSPARQAGLWLEPLKHIDGGLREPLVAVVKLALQIHIDAAALKRRVDSQAAGRNIRFVSRVTDAPSSLRIASRAETAVSAAIVARSSNRSR